MVPPWGKNKTTFAVTFTEEPADSALRTAVERELDQTKYQTFSNLCKQALWQFLSVSETTPLDPPDLLAPKLEQQLSELQLNLAQFEQRLSSQQSKGLGELESLLLQLTKQMDNLSNLVNQREISPVVATQSDPVTKPEGTTELPANVSSQPSEEVDPILSRLGKLMDTF